MLVHSQDSRRLRTVGITLMVLGVWGALVPFVGPSFGYGMGGSQAWTWSESHTTLHLLPGMATVLGAALLLRAQYANQLLGTLLAGAGGVWFVIAPTLHPLWAGDGMSGMSRMNGMGDSALDSALSGLGYHYGTGVVIAVLAAYAVGTLLAAQKATTDDRVDAAAEPTGSTAEGSSFVNVAD